MPESVRNRCTKAHEYVFLLTKGMKYFYDAEAIKEVSVSGGQGDRKYNTAKKAGRLLNGRSASGNERPEAPPVPNPTKSNKRSVWTVSSSGYEGAHFATFPPKLIEPAVLVGTSEKGVCSECLAPYRRVVEERKLRRERPNEYVKRNGAEGTGNSCKNTVAGVETKTVGWEPTCKCGAGIAPAVVLDPFVGSGTTVVVAVTNGRSGVGIDLSEKYLRNNAIPRIEGELLARPGLAELVRRR